MDRVQTSENFQRAQEPTEEEGCDALTLSMLLVLSRMMDEWASRSKIWRVETFEYMWCGLKSSAMNFSLCIVLIMSSSTGRGMFGDEYS